jgi:hypothetical protein
MAMLMRKDISPASSQISAGKSPVPYLLGGVGAMLVLIAFALIILACSYLKECTGEGQENNRSEHNNVELGSGGKNEMSQDMSNASDDKDDIRVFVTMPGDQKPTFMAKPASVTAGLN